MSDPEEGFPAWLRLDWDEPVMAAEVQLVFDTALHRHLTLSHHDGYTATMAWGMPQAETVRDYVVQGFDGDTWHDLASVTENHQRLRRHRAHRLRHQLRHRRRRRCPRRRLRTVLKKRFFQRSLR